MASACSMVWVDPLTKQDESGSDFEFTLQNPGQIIHADELFLDGKIVAKDINLSDPDPDPDPISNPTSNSHPTIFSPKAPKCSSRWKEILGLKKIRRDHTSPIHLQSSKSKFQFLHKSSPACVSITTPLLNDVPSRPSLSAAQEDLPRVSLHSENPNPRKTPNPNRSRTMVAKGGRSEGSMISMSVDSPRMNSCGKVVFQSSSLERSSSSPSSFNAGPRFNHRGMERSYSANIVRVSPVINIIGSSKSPGVFSLFTGGTKSAHQNTKNRPS